MSSDLEVAGTDIDIWARWSANIEVDDSDVPGHSSVISMGSPEAGVKHTRTSLSSDPLATEVIPAIFCAAATVISARKAFRGILEIDVAYRKVEKAEGVLWRSKVLLLGRSMKVEVRE